MPATPLNRAAIADATDRSIQKMFKKDADVELTLGKYYNKRTTTDYFEKDSSLTGLSVAVFADENSQVTEDAPINFVWA